ncbi:uncharacterized protein LOC106653592 [Trichogramma pretiosum]|uniref:uncharacterized protein LOC106653592 n=1 Tax=Trichogramma pretiosum TaxID=7493 RepID=UPI0006C94BBB|nr:uncharacterized protein LOC106653592 [Trichogramma pretiosum]
MRTRTPLLQLLLAICCCFFCCSASSITNQDALKKLKRYFVFPQGSNIQVVYCLTIGAEGRPDGDLVLGLTAALAYELPSSISDDAINDNVLHRRSRAAVYPKIEAFLQSTGLDGRSCVMRALCEAGTRHPSQRGSGSFVQELLHAIFTLRQDGGSFDREDHREYDEAATAAHEARNCAELYPSCQQSIYELDF